MPRVTDGESIVKMYTRSNRYWPGVYYYHKYYNVRMVVVENRFTNDFDFVMSVVIKRINIMFVHLGSSNLENACRKTK